MGVMDIIYQVLASPLLMVEAAGAGFLGLIMLVIAVRWVLGRRQKAVEVETVVESRVGGRWSEVVGALVYHDGDTWMVHREGNKPVFLYVEPPDSIIAPIAVAFKDLPDQPVHVVNPKRNCRTCAGLGKPEGAWGSEAAIGKCVPKQGRFIFKPVSDCQLYTEDYL